MNYNLSNEKLKEIFDFYFESHGQQVEEVLFHENRVLIRTKSKIKKQIDIPEFIHKRPHRSKFAIG
ncbi:hypothetical protein KY998_05010 [Bacillus paralicheniformis]|jgi:hypothetical protein|uniref:hypothetical protein n=1 Tax=Bacillus TaxID=1386 RepID=UPI00093307CD|nr:MULTISPECIES: hypothetical protein [Bacillus]ARC58788.1 hypothetical protein BaDB11_00119 [Bacillus licheniformis]MBM6849541.1 hypothetical protein [Bacillus licheniformis]MDE1362773.1 hypothetical protein [Bacillus paralicheniformis]MDE1425503.1 hypothetical protein [Bacillus licheniformis]MDE1457124.1 hypothetical protein [Bacillus licheniformis]